MSPTTYHLIMSSNVSKRARSSLVLTAKGINDFGDWVATVAAPVLLYSSSESISNTAILMACRLAPYLMANLVIKRAVRSHIPPSSIIRGASLLRALIIPLFLIANTPLHFYALTLAVYSLGASASPCYFSIIKGCAQGEGGLSQSNNYLLALQNGMSVVGPVIGAYIQLHFGYGFLFALNSICCFFAFALSFRFPEPSDCNSRREQKSAKTHMIVSAYPLISMLILVDAVSGLAFGSLNAIIPMVCQTRFNNDAVVYSMLLAFLTGGMLLGNLVFHALFHKKKASLLYMKVTLFALFTYLLFNFAQSSIIGALLLALTGIGNSIQDVTLITTIQKTVADENDAAYIISLRDSFGAATTLCSVAILSTVTTSNSILGICIILWLSSTLVCLVIWLFGRKDR